MAKKKATPTKRIEIIGAGEPGSDSRHVDIQIGRHYFMGPDYARRRDAIRAANRIREVLGDEWLVVEW